MELEIWAKEIEANRYRGLPVFLTTFYVCSGQQMAENKKSRE